MAVSANKTSILEFTCAKLSGIAGRPVRYRVFREDGRSRFIRGSRCRNRADRLGCVSYRHQAGRPARREAASSTTRRLALTPEVETFLAHARGILSAVEAAEAAVASTHGRARGHIRLNSGTAFAKHKLARLLPDFFAQYPDITIDLSVSDQRIDPIFRKG